MHASIESTLTLRPSPRPARRVALAGACLLAAACAAEPDATPGSGPSFSESTRDERSTESPSSSVRSDRVAASPAAATAAQVEARPAPQAEPGVPLADPSRNGPHPSTTLSRTGPGGGYTVYLPADLATSGKKAPILGWMSGGGTTHGMYALLPRLATHGFVVVAADVVPGIGTEVDLGRQQLAGIDWAISENGRAGSPLADKLDTSKIGALGYSMGSLATFTIAADKRLTTTVHLSGGNFEPARVQNLHAPAAFLCGAPNPSCNILSPSCDIAAVNCDRDFQNADTPVFYANHAGGHLGVLADPHASRINTLTVAWLRWKLFDEEARSSTFVGADCAACKDAFWKVKQKNLE